MHYSTTTLQKSEMEIKIELSAEETTRSTKRILNEACQTAEVDGFRKGKAPLELVKQKLGEAELSSRAVLRAIQDSYPEIIKEITEKSGPDFEPIGTPEIHVTKFIEGSGLSYVARISLLPALNLMEYKKTAKEILAEKRAQEVSEKEIDESILWLRKSRAQEITVARPAAMGDRVEIDFEARVGGALLDQGRSQNHPLIIGEGRFIAGFEEELVGMKEGETKTFSIVAPKDYKEESLRDKVIDFQVSMKLVQKHVLPEANDEFASGLGRFDNIADLTSSIRQGILAEKEKKERDRIRIKIIEAIAEKTSAEIPDILVGRELEKMIAELKDGIQRTGLDWTTYLANIKKSEEELKKGWVKDAERRVKIALVLRRIARTEKIEPTEEEIQEATNKTVARLGISEEDFEKIDPVRSRTRTHPVRGNTANGAGASATSNGIDRNAFLEYNTTVARNEKVFRFLENL